MRNNRWAMAFGLTGAFLVFQVAVMSSELIRPLGETAGMSMGDRWTSWAQELIDRASYFNPFAAFFIYVALLRLGLLDRRMVQQSVGSIIYYALFGLYFGLLFKVGVNSYLHGRFDQGLGINPGPVGSAIFPLFLVFALPFLVTVVLKWSTRSLRGHQQP